MPGMLMEGARCWNCQRTLLAVGRTIHGATGRATVTFHHHRDAARFRNGKRPEPCKVRMSADESDWAMNGLPREPDLGAKEVR
jgi:hypothetical protein